MNAGSSTPIELNDDFIMQFAKICVGDISPMAAAIGGIVAQVIIMLHVKEEIVQVSISFVSFRK